MTNVEAIIVLKYGMKYRNPKNDTEKDRNEALDMAISALSAEPCREADDYENEIADLHNRLDIAEYDKERYKEEITTLEADNKTLRVKLENAEEVLRGLKEDLEDARAELRERW